MATTPKINLKKDWYLGALLILFCALYFTNLDGWLMHDDEGTDFYEVTQLLEGQRPGIDYLAEQQPLYLLSGRLLISQSTRPAFMLRAFSAAQIILGALIFAFAVNHIWGKQTAILTLGILLGCGMLYEQARLFRPDPMMMAWEMVGLACALLAVHKNSRWLWAAAGASFGVAVLWKLFGVFPVVGLILFFVYWLAKEKSRWQDIIISGLYFAVPFLLVIGGTSLLLYSQLGFYYQEAFNYHLEANQNNGLTHQLLIVGGGYLLFLVSNAIFIFILPLRFLNRSTPRNKQWVTAVLLTQLLTPLIFIFIPRPIHLRYYLFLLPPLAIILAIEVQFLLNKIQIDAPKAKPIIPIIITLIIVAGWTMTQPNIPNLLLRQEQDTLALAALVAERTEPTDVVVSDYAGINFFAKRPSIYEGSIIAGAQIESGSVTGQLIIQRIEETDAKMVLIHVEGGEPTPHQLVKLVDYEQFRDYLFAHFQLVTIFDRAGQQIEVFERK